MDFQRASLLTDKKGNHVFAFEFGGLIQSVSGNKDSKTVNFAVKNGMPPEEFAIGLRALADHVENELNG